MQNKNIAIEDEWINYYNLKKNNITYIFNLFFFFHKKL